MVEEECAELVFDAGDGLPVGHEWNRRPRASSLWERRVGGQDPAFANEHGKGIVDPPWRLGVELEPYTAAEVDRNAVDENDVLEDTVMGSRTASVRMEVSRVGRGRTHGTTGTPSPSPAASVSLLSCPFAPASFASSSNFPDSPASLT